MLTIAIFVLAMVRHKDNLVRLARGEERRLEAKGKKVQNVESEI